MAIVLYELVGGDASRPFSPHCWKTLMSLAHKGLDYRREAVPFTDVPKVESGAGKTVPIIRDGERVVVDSFDIALYLDEAYPDRPSLFGGEGGKSMARFIEAWAATQINAVIIGHIVQEIHQMLAPEDQIYFRHSRESRFGMSLEECRQATQERFDSLQGRLDPLRFMLKRQPFIGGESPHFCDYIVFGAFQWSRICSPVKMLDADDPVHEWFESLLDLYDGLGRSVPAAA